MASMLWTMILCSVAVEVAARRVKITASETGQALGPVAAQKPQWREQFEEYMAALEKTDNKETTSDGNGFNTRCRGYISDALGQESKGLVILQHGYTACAGFWYLLAPQLSQAGWTVMVPNMVGHGRIPKVRESPDKNGTYEVEDYTEELPIHGSQYVEYADKIIEIVKQFSEEQPDKPIVLTGISLGGTVALYMSMQAPELWDRVMLMNPFIQPPTSLGADYGLSFFGNILPKFMPAFSLIRGDMISWGETCDKKRWPGHTSHGGICQFTLNNFAAVFQFANTVEYMARKKSAQYGVISGGLVDRIEGAFRYAFSSLRRKLGRKHERKAKKGVKIQLLTSIKDSAIANARVHSLAKAFSKSPLKKDYSYCVMPEEMGHVYICPKDTPDRDHWWLDSEKIEGGATVLDMLASFIADGNFVPKGEGTVPGDEDKFIEGDPLCQVEKNVLKMAD